MDFLDYMQMSAGQKFAYKFKTFFKTLPSNIGQGLYLVWSESH